MHHIVINSDLPQVDVENLSKEHRIISKTLSSTVTSSNGEQHVRCWEINAGGFTRIEQHLFQNTANYLRRTKSFAGAAGAGNMMMMMSSGRIQNINSEQDSSNSPLGSGNGIMSHSMLNLAGAAAADYSQFTNNEINNG